MQVRAVVPGLLALVLAGCAGAPGAVPEDPPPAHVTVHEWRGRIQAGAASELPAHFPETAPLVAPLWPENMRNFEIVDPPTFFVVTMTWSGGPGTQVQLMVEAPAHEDRVDLYTAPAAGAFTEDATLCVPVPPEAIVAGHWKVMPHTRAGANVDFTIAVALTGGAGAFTEEMEHWQTSQEFAQRSAAGNVQDHPAEPCLL